MTTEKHLDETEVSIEAPSTSVPSEAGTDPFPTKRFRNLSVVVIATIIVLVLVIVLPVTLIHDNSSDDDNGDKTEITSSSELAMIVPDWENIDAPIGPWNCSMVSLTTGCDAVRSIEALHKNLSFPEHLEDFDNFNPVVKGCDFDVKTYFDVFQHISLDDGYSLDYVYQFDGMGGFPILYVRAENEQPFLTAQDYRNKMCTETYPCPETENYLDSIRTDDTPEGYWEWVIMHILGDQFYLFWHSGYNDHRIVCDLSTLDAIFLTHGPNGYGCYDDNCLTECDRVTMNNVDLTPTIECNGSSVSVRLVTFTAWGGFFHRTYIISREDSGSPIRLLDTEIVNIVEYQTGIAF